MLIARDVAEPRQDQRARRRIGVAGGGVERAFQRAPPLVLVARHLGEPEQRAHRRPPLDRRLQRRRVLARLAIARLVPGQEAAEVEPGLGARRAVRGSLGATAQRLIDRAHRHRRRAPRAGGRTGAHTVGQALGLGEGERPSRRIGDAQQDPPRPLGDHGLDQDAVPAAAQLHADRVLVQLRGADHVARVRQQPIDPHLGRPRRAQAQRRGRRAVDVHEGVGVGGGLRIGPQETVDVEHALANHAGGRTPGDVALLAGILARRIGRAVVVLGRKALAEARAAVAEGTDHGVGGHEAERGAAPIAGRRIGACGAAAAHPCRPADRRRCARPGSRPARRPADRSPSHRRSRARGVRPDQVGRPRTATPPPARARSPPASRASPPGGPPRRPDRPRTAWRPQPATATARRRARLRRGDHRKKDAAHTHSQRRAPHHHEERGLYPGLRPGCPDRTARPRPRPEVRLL